MREILQLFTQMDHAYDATARAAGFECRGCEDNCCLTRFQHHTLMEYLYLQEGLSKLPHDQLIAVTERARHAVAQMAKMAQRNEPIRVMCPLNTGGRCALYANRPMICRLHGVAHALRRPDGQRQTGPGCDDYYTQCGNLTARHLDRTPLYVAMADLERRLRAELKFNRKIKMTIAEMIINEIY